MTAFILCADDFAMTAGVSQGILELAGLHRISATSAMTNMMHWAAHSRDLQQHVGQIDLGIHLNLTLGSPLGTMHNLAPSGVFPSIKEISRRAFRGSIDVLEIESEIDRQCEAFEAHMQMQPDFIDGHQHVHSLAPVRKALIAVMNRRYPGLKPYLRDPCDRLSRILRRGTSILKALAVSAVGHGLADAADYNNIRVNAGFAGFNRFDPLRDFAKDFESYLVAPGPRHLVMCHPGFIDDDLISMDPVVATRPLELEFLKSARFLEKCDAAGIRPARFNEL